MLTDSKQIGALSFTSFIRIVIFTNPTFGGLPRSNAIAKTVKVSVFLVTKFSKSNSEYCSRSSDFSKRKTPVSGSKDSKSETSIAKRYSTRPLFPISLSVAFKVAIF